MRAGTGNGQVALVGGSRRAADKGYSRSKRCSVRGSMGPRSTFPGLGFRCSGRVSDCGTFSIMADPFQRLSQLPRILLVPALQLCFASALAAGSADVPATQPSPAAELLQTAQEGYRISRANFTYRLQESNVEDVCRWSARWLETERELRDVPEQRTNALRDHIARLADVENLCRDKCNNGIIGPLPGLAVRFCRIEAEQQLAKISPK